MGPVKKRYTINIRMGRMDMMRSNPEEKIEVKQTIKVDLEEEDDLRYFVTGN